MWLFRSNPEATQIIDLSFSWKGPHWTTKGLSGRVVEMYVEKDATDDYCVFLPERMPADIEKIGYCFELSCIKGQQLTGAPPAGKTLAEVCHTKKIQISVEKLRQFKMQIVLFNADGSQRDIKIVSIAYPQTFEKVTACRMVVTSISNESERSIQAQVMALEEETKEKVCSYDPEKHDLPLIFAKNALAQLLYNQLLINMNAVQKNLLTYYKKESSNKADARTVINAEIDKIDEGNLRVLMNETRASRRKTEKASDAEKMQEVIARLDPVIFKKIMHSYLTQNFPQPIGDDVAANIEYSAEHLKNLTVSPMTTAVWEIGKTVGQTVLKGVGYAIPGIMAALSAAAKGDGK